MNRVGSLDHVGVVSHQLDALAARFEALGFRLTPFARQAGGRVGSRCIMLRGGYVELLAIVAGASSATLQRFLAHREGAHIVALGVEDTTAVADRLRLVAGAASGSPTNSERLVDDADPQGPRARFDVITVGDRPEGRVNLVRHLTPDVLWQGRFLHHANRAQFLCEVVLRAPDPANTAAWFGAVAGWPLVPDPAGGYALDLPQGRVRVLPAEDETEAASIAALTIRTADGNRALTRLLDDRGVSHDRDGNDLTVEAGGVALRFTPA